MLRIAIILVAVILFFICTLPVLFVFKLLYPKYPEKIDHASLAIVKWAFRTVLRLSGTQLTVIGEENVPTDQPVLYVGNHTSFFDIIITYARMPGLTGYVAKKSVAKVPVLNLWMNRVHCLFLDRDNIKEGLKTILAAIEKVKAGISIFIFPEGTRNKTPDTLLDFKEGSFKIAEKSGCLIVPVTLVNASDIFEDHFPWIKKTKVVVEYSTPVDMKALDKEDRKHIGAYVQNIIAEIYKKNKAEYF